MELGIDLETEELDNFKKAMEEKNLTPLRCEWVIYDERIEKASAIDLVCKDEDGKIVIVDLKTMAKPIKKKPYGGKHYYDPISHVPDSKFHKQSLQVSIYQKWLTELYEEELADQHYVLRLRDNLYKFIPVEDLTEEINKLYTKIDNEQN